MIKKGIKVKVLTGKDKNKDGEVIQIDRQNNKAKVKGINMVKKHVKTTKEKKGGIISKENFIHISNLAIIDTKSNNKTEIKKLSSGQKTPHPSKKKLSLKKFKYIKKYSQV